MKAKVNKVSIQILQGDLLSLPVSGIIAQTDTNLHLSAELLARAGASVQRACAAIGWCDVGQAVITDAGNLPFEKIIHAVGPRWGEGSERGKLDSVTFECLRLAEQARLKSVALPAISVGTLGYPVENCATTMLTRILDFALDEPKFLRSIVVCVQDPAVYTAFVNEFRNQIEELVNTDDGEITILGQP